MSLSRTGSNNHKPKVNVNITVSKNGTSIYSQVFAPGSAGAVLSTIVELATSSVGQQELHDVEVVGEQGSMAAKIVWTDDSSKTVVAAANNLKLARTRKVPAPETTQA